MHAQEAAILLCSRAACVECGIDLVGLSFAIIFAVSFAISSAISGKAKTARGAPWKRKGRPLSSKTVARRGRLCARKKQGLTPRHIFRVKDCLHPRVRWNAFVQSEGTPD